MGAKSAHKDAIARGGGKVGGVVRGQAQTLVRNHNGRLRQGKHVRDHCAIDCARPIPDAEAAPSLLQRMACTTPYCASCSTMHAGDCAQGPTWPVLEMYGLKRSWLRQEAVLQAVEGTHRSAEPVSKQTVSS